MDKSALVCDMAETYHIYDIMRMPAKYVGVLASGLRDDSRIMQKILGVNADTDTILLARLLDCFNIWLWSHTKDGEKGRNRPESFTEKMLGTEKPKERQTESFATPDEFERRRAELVAKLKEEKNNV